MVWSPMFPPVPSCSNRDGRGTRVFARALRVGLPLVLLLRLISRWACWARTHKISRGLSETKTFEIEGKCEVSLSSKHENFISQSHPQIQMKVIFSDGDTNCPPRYLVPQLSNEPRTRRPEVKTDIIIIFNRSFQSTRMPPVSSIPTPIPIPIPIPKMHAVVARNPSSAPSGAQISRDFHRRIQVIDGVRQFSGVLGRSVSVGWSRSVGLGRSVSGGRSRAGVRGCRPRLRRLGRNAFTGASRFCQ
jgi:hypothetical protein